MFEGSNIHLSPIDGKKLCSFSQKICKQHRLNGFAFCIRHILEDKSSPFKQCQYTMKSNGEKCFNPVPMKFDRIYCNSHLQVLGLLPKPIPKKLVDSKNSFKNTKKQIIKKLKNQKLQKKRRNQLLLLNKKMKRSTVTKINERKSALQHEDDKADNKTWHAATKNLLKNIEKDIHDWKKKSLPEDVEKYRQSVTKRNLDDIYGVHVIDEIESSDEDECLQSYQSSLLVTPERTHHNDLHVDNTSTQERKVLNKLRHQYGQLKATVCNKKVKEQLSYSVLSKLIQSVKKDPLETANVINVAKNPRSAVIFRDRTQKCSYNVPCCMVTKKSRCPNSVVPYTKYCKKHILNDEEQLIYFKPNSSTVQPSTYVNGVTYTFLCNSACKMSSKKKGKTKPDEKSLKFEHTKTSNLNRPANSQSDESDLSSLNESSDFNDKTNSGDSSEGDVTETEDETPEEAFHLPAGSISSFSPVHVEDEDSLSALQNRNVEFEDEDDVELIRCKPFSFESNNSMSRDLSSPTLNQLSSSNFNNSFNSGMFLSPTKGLSSQSIVSPMTASFFSSFNHNSSGSQAKPNRKEDVVQADNISSENSSTTLKISPLNNKTQNMHFNTKFASKVTTTDNFDVGKDINNSKNGTSKQSNVSVNNVVSSSNSCCEIPKETTNGSNIVDNCHGKAHPARNDFTNNDGDAIPLERVNPDIFFSSTFSVGSSQNEKNLTKKERF